MLCEEISLEGLKKTTVGQVYPGDNWPSEASLKLRLLPIFLLRKLRKLKIIISYTYNAMAQTFLRPERKMEKYINRNTYKLTNKAALKTTGQNNHKLDSGKIQNHVNN